MKKKFGKFSRSSTQPINQTSKETKEKEKKKPIEKRSPNPIKYIEVNAIEPPISDKLYNNVMETTINSHGGRALLENKSNLYEKYHSIPLFKEMLLPALKYGCTLLLPYSIFPSVDFYLTHLIRRHPQSQRGITLNGNYVKISERIDIYRQPHNSKTYPWKLCIDPFKNFPLNMDINLPDDMEVRDDGYDGGIEDTIQLIGNGIIMTPLGDLPVLKVSRPFNLEGCTWGIRFDELSGLQWSDTRVIKFNKECVESDVNELMYHTVYEDKALQFAMELETEEIYEETRNYLRVVIENTRTMFLNLRIEEMGDIFRKIVNGIMNKIPKEEIENSDFTPDVMRLTIESILVHQFFYDIWPPFIEETTRVQQLSCQKDRELDWRILALQFIQFKDLEIEFLNCPVGQHGIDVVIQQLRRMNSFKNPHQKVVILISALKFLQYIIYKTVPKGGPVSADIFFPTLVYVIIKANIPFFASNIDYIKAFMNKPLDEQNYYITCIESVFCFIENLEGSNIGWKESDFFEALNVSKMHTNPFDFTTINSLRANRIAQVAPFERIKEPCEIIGRSRTQLLHAFKEVIKENNYLKEQIDEFNN